MFGRLLSLFGFMRPKNIVEFENRIWQLELKVATVEDDHRKVLNMVTKVEARHRMRDHRAKKETEEQTQLLEDANFNMQAGELFKKADIKAFVKNPKAAFTEFLLNNHEEIGALLPQGIPKARQLVEDLTGGEDERVIHGL